MFYTICDFCGKEFEMSIGSGKITIEERINHKECQYVSSISNACPSCLNHILLYKEKKRMIKLENWTEITKGLYRYVVSTGRCYEIYIMHHEKDTDILSANASLYNIVGDWTTDNSYCSYFDRELLLNGSLMACLEKAVEEEKEIKND